MRKLSTAGKESFVSFCSLQPIARPTKHPPTNYSEWGYILREQISLLSLVESLTISAYIVSNTSCPL